MNLAQLLRLRVAFHTLPLFYLRTHGGQEEKKTKALGKGRRGGGQVTGEKKAKALGKGWRGGGQITGEKKKRKPWVKGGEREGR